MATVYDKQEKESMRAFAAFCIYRDMGPKRSITGAYFRERESAGKAAGKKAPNDWWRWASEHDWKRRAAAFDIEEDRRQRTEAQEIQRQAREAYRLRVIQQAQQRADVAGRMLDKVLARLEKISEGEIPVGAVPAYLREATAVWREAIKVEGIGLGLLDADGKPMEEQGTE